MGTPAPADRVGRQGGDMWRRHAMAGQRAAVERVLIVGGGLAGLSLAIALGKEGVEVEVVDVTDRVEKVGLGLIARVMHAFEELGVLDDCRADGFVMPGFSSIFTYM